MRDENLVLIKNPVLFLDDWPQPPKCATNADELLDAPGFNDIKKWRLQTLLAVNPYGIPSLGFAAAYEKMFGKELDFKDIGFEHLWDMVSQMTDVFAVQEPDELTELLFPEYPSDKILHDTRLGYDFEKLQCGQLLNKEDPEILNSHAWFNRDDDFPEDVVLAGEKYQDLILPMTEANVPGTRGIYKAVLVSVASPTHFYVNIKSEYLELVTKLSSEVKRYFDNCGESIEKYRLPEEFIHSGFACLVYIKDQKCWERCSIIGRRRDKVLVETVDFGGTHLVDQSCLYLMPKRFFDLPKQGLLLSLIGLKSHDGQKWSATVGSRMRCFSNLHYYLDILLLEPQNKLTETTPIESKSVNPISDSGEKKKKKKEKIWQAKVQFEVIVCDRNDEDLDLFLDEILIMETFCAADQKRFEEEVEPLRSEFKKALVQVLRPTNPL